MDWLYWSLGVLGCFVAAALVTAYVCYRMAFYVSDKQKKENAARTLPPGQEYLPFHDQMAAWQAEVKTFPCEKVSVTSFDGLILKGNYYERFPGAVVELALDRGVLLGGGQELPFAEMEVELKEGSEEAAIRFAQALAEEFSLEPAHKSKHARAVALARQK